VLGTGVMKMSWTELGGFFTRCEHGLFDSGRKSSWGA